MSDAYDKGMAIRREVLGADYVDRAMAAQDEFSRPLQDLLTEFCWGGIWGREDLDRRTRSLVTLGILTALNRPKELETHIRAARTNGCTVEEIREVLLQTAVYCGVPAAVDSFRIARGVLADLDTE